MKKLLLLALVALGGVMNASAWGDLYLICGENGSWAKGSDNGSNDNYKNDAFKFTCVTTDSYRATVPGSYIENGPWYFRFRDASSDSWKSISPANSSEDQEVTQVAVTTNWQNSDSKAFFVSQNTDAKYVQIFANWNNSTSSWELTSNVITSTTEYTVAYSDQSGWSSVHAYAFLDGVALNSAWPGSDMTSVGNNIYTATFTGAEGAKIIFNNGYSGDTNQSWTFDVADNGVYTYSEKVENVSASVTSATGYATFSSAYPLNFSGTSITAYTVSNLSNTSVTLTQVTEVPAGTGLIIQGSGSQDIPTKIVTSSVGTNKLQAALTATVVADDYAYVLSNGEFHPANAGTIPAGKAYLLKSDVPSQARSLSLMFDDATGIGTLQTVSVEDNVFYNLGGQRVAAPTKGMYIVNGKKVIIK